MRKLVLSSMVLVLILSLACWATDTRVMTLGDANNIVEDDANIWMYPSTIVNYGGMIIGEFGWSTGVYDLDRLGAHFNCGDDGKVIGFYLSQVAEDPGYGPWVPDHNGLNNGVDHKLDLFFGMPMGDNQFGAGLSFYSDSWSEDYMNTGAWPDTSKAAQGNFMLNLMAGLTFNDNLDAAVHFGMASFTNDSTSGDVLDEPNGIMFLGATGRYWMDHGNDYVGIPHVMFWYATNGIKGFYDNTIPGELDIKDSQMGFDLGYGMNLTPDDDILVIADIGFQYISEKQAAELVGSNPKMEQETTESTFVLPYFRLGLEGNVTSWWDVRVGATKFWTSTSWEQTFTPAFVPPHKDSDKFGWADTETYVGSGIHFGNLELDLEIDPFFLAKGPNFVSNYNGQLANRVSLVYTFDAVNGD
ncbi:hypothetical protein CEE37_02180 [candidate division LCP-89 bacterium B3_LCP]|uniref:DUF5723 domain-containing protein n=1 Tax=candidate division LCP-89 bacterium B3_LCP TaxID=2012998 RepID=A0A532V5P0_UNCL8|nr:MAG: hypothetical protein CEE37_02180 [candidate division LCP-89 bacterium B3_LCP]